MQKMNLKEKWNSLSPAKKASFALIFAQFCQKGLSMISTPIFTRIMATEQYGEITNFTSWQSIIMIIATLNLSQGVFNNGMLEFREDRERFTASTLLLANICTFVVFGLYLLFYGVLSPIVGLSKELMFLMFLYMIFYPAYSYWSCRQRYEFKYKSLTIITICASAVQIIAGIAAVLLSNEHQQALAKLIASEVVLILLGLVMHIVIVVKSKFRFSFRYIKYAFAFNIFLVPHYLAMTVLASGDRVMITAMVGKTQTAIYGVSYTAAAIISTLGQAVEYSWAPWLFEHLNADDRKPIPKRANQIALLYASAAIACMLFAPEIMKILASNAYAEGYYIIPSVTTGVYFSSIYALYMRLEYYSKKTKATMVGSLLAAGANIVLNYIFIKLFGYIAAGYTTLACYILLYLFHFWYTRRIGMKNIYDDKRIAILSWTLVAFAICVTFTYSHPIMRYSLIGLLVILLFVFRKAVIEQVKAIFR